MNLAGWNKFGFVYYTFLVGKHYACLEEVAAEGFYAGGDLLDGGVVAVECSEDEVGDGGLLHVPAALEGFVDVLWCHGLRGLKWGHALFQPRSVQRDSSQ